MQIINDNIVDQNMVSKTWFVVTDTATFEGLTHAQAVRIAYNDTASFDDVTHWLGYLQ